MRVSDGETNKNVFVNVVPLGILVYFALLFVIFDAGENPYFLASSIGLLVIPFAALAPGHLPFSASYFNGGSESMPIRRHRRR